MKLPVVYISKRAFTLVELMMVMGILFLLIIVSLPLSINFYNTRQLDVHENGIVQALRRAQLKAMSVEADSSFGVYVSSDQYVLFRGSSYAARDAAYDEVFNLPDNLSITGLSEIVFNKLRGVPSVTGSIVLTINDRVETISVNEVGRVNY